ncbi:MAG: voltage-gated potassium channel [Acidobacteriota bacterium]|jgi:voltage-gated potassium channel|nr:voltage-gated potassium channel [Acidobacteriota bacterium]
MSSKPSRSSRFVQGARFRLRYALYAVLAAIALGTLGFYLLERWSVSDSLYATIQTLTTVGYGDVTPQTTAGRIFASFYMIVGVGAVLYVLTSTVQTIVQSEMIATFGMRRRQREMSKLHDHFIICGAGRVGSRLIRELQRASVPFAVIEKDAQKVAHLIESGAPVVVGDATLEETLREVGVDRARGLAACLPDDADNVYAVLTARDLNHNLHIVARAVEEQAEPKLIKAGANRVVAPTITGSHRMAQALMKPAVADFMDSITAENLDLSFEQMEIATGSAYAGRKLRFTNILSELNIIIVAIRRRNSQMTFNPTGDAIIDAGDTLIAIGQAEALIRMNALARGIGEQSDS